VLTGGNLGEQRPSLTKVGILNWYDNDLLECIRMVTTLQMYRQQWPVLEAKKHELDK
jgi:hypothetical protein